MLLFVLIFVFLPARSTGQLTCSAQTWSFESDLNNGFLTYTSVDNAANSGYLMESTEYHVPDACTCGVLVSWTFFPRSAGDIKLQVWEHVDSTTYNLKGENYFTVPSSAIGQVIEFKVPLHERITIRNGYLLGWKGVESGIIGYEEVEGYPDEQRREPNIADFDVDADPTFDWSSGTSIIFVNRVYAIGATSGSNTAPEFTNLPRSVKIYADATPGSFIYQITADDIDPRDVSTLAISTTNDATTPFYYVRSSKSIYLGSYSAPVGTYTLTFDISDQCGNQNRNTLTIEVLNWAPVMSGLPSFAVIDELTTDAILLGNISITDRDNTTWVEQGSLNNAPTGVSLQYHSTNKTSRNIVGAKNADFQYSSTSSIQYIMDITFSDGIAQTDKGYFMLYITTNSPPVFTNLNTGAQATVSYLSTANGDFVYAVSATDAENDPLTYTLTCEVPSPCPFDIDDDGVVTVTEDMIRKYTPGYDLVITVGDAKNPTAETRTLTVLVEDINDIPVIVNLPLAYALGVSENTALGTTIYTVSYVDLDTTDTHAVYATWAPTWGQNYFHLNETSGELTTALNVIDFEFVMVEYSTNIVTVTIMVSDSEDWATETLTINIMNVNESPSLHQTEYTLEPPEQGVKGVSVGWWDSQVIDEDTLVASLAETHTYSWDCGDSTRYFRMNKDTGDVTYATLFDYDNTDLTSPFNCVVTVTDKAGLSATTTLQIDIIDENDNGPVFAQTTDNYIFQTHNLAPGRFVGQVTATDADKSELYSRIYYSFSVSPFKKGFLLINDFGNIYVNETWTEPLFDYGISYDLVVLAENVVDDTPIRKTATASVTLFLIGTSTTTTSTTDKPVDFMEDTRNVGWMSVALTLGGVLLLIILGFILIYTVQVKRYRWCIPWCRKKVLGLKKMTKKEKRRYYRGLLQESERGYDSDGSDQGYPNVALIRDPGDSDGEADYAPPMLWNKRREDVPKGPTVRQSNKVPQAATYEEPKPPKITPSKMMGQPSIWN